jgi:hypothetical protein
MGAAEVTAWMPSTLAISITSRISCAVAPYPRAFSMCSVAGEEFRVQPEDVLPGVVPGPVELDELGLDVLLALRQ